MRQLQASQAEALFVSSSKRGQVESWRRKTQFKSPSSTPGPFEPEVSDLPAPSDSQVKANAAAAEQLIKEQKRSDAFTPSRSHTLGLLTEFKIFSFSEHNLNKIYCGSTCTLSRGRGDGEGSGKFIRRTRRVYSHSR